MPITSRATPVAAKGTGGSSLGMAGQLCCTTGGEGEVGDSSRIHVEKVKRGSAVKRGKEKRVPTTASSDTKLRIIGRLNLMVSKPFLYIYIYIYIYRVIYNSNGGGYHTRVCRQYFLYSIFYISTFYNKYY